MEIYLLQDDRIKEEALHQLLESEGYEVIYTGNRRVKPQDIFKREKSLLMLVGVNFLSSFGKAEVIDLCNKQHRIILLGKLKQLYWLFEFPYDEVGFICQNEKINNLYDAVRNLNTGQVYLSHEITHFLNQSLLERQEKLFEQTLLEPFTPMELGILKEIGDGKKSNQIAKDLFKSVHTINNHRSHITRKLSFEKRIRVIKFCVQNREAILSLISLNEHKNRLHQWLKNDHK